MTLHYDDVIERRLEFLLSEAKSPNPTSDRSVVYTMRILSNYFTIGKTDVDSYRAKLLNRRMSRRAQELLVTLDDAILWNEATKNEHPEPLNQTWNWILDQKEKLTTRAIAQRIALYPMITVTNEEDKTLRKNGHQSSGSPDERYAAAGIEIVNHGQEPRVVLQENRRKGGYRIR
jgi:hypothetical protein